MSFDYKVLRTSFRTKDQDRFHSHFAREKTSEPVANEKRKIKNSLETCFAQNDLGIAHCFLSRYIRTVLLF